MRFPVVLVFILTGLVCTAQGIGVGSTQAELRSTCEVAGIGYGEGRVFAVVESLGASFELDWSQVERSIVMTGDANQVPDETAAIGVLLVKRQ